MNMVTTSVGRYSPKSYRTISSACEIADTRYYDNSFNYFRSRRVNQPTKKKKKKHYNNQPTYNNNIVSY